MTKDRKKVLVLLELDVDGRTTADEVRHHVRSEVRASRGQFTGSYYGYDWRGDIEVKLINLATHNKRILQEHGSKT